MAILSPPPFVQGGSHTSKQVRQFIAALAGQPVETFVNSVGAVGMAHGLARPGDLTVTQAGTPNMSVNVSAGRCFISGNSSLVQGAYVFTNDAVQNVVIATADGSNPRRDLVCAQARETIEDASGQNDARMFVVTGTPAASPVFPAIPAGCEVLAWVTVAAAVTSIVNADITTVVGLARASNWNQAWGVVGRAQITAGTGSHGIGTFDIVGLSVTFTAVAGRRYKVTTSAILDSNHGSIQLAALLIDIAAARVKETALLLLANPGPGDTATFVCTWDGTITAGSATVKSRVTFSAGSGNSVIAASTDPAQLLIEDIGPA